METHSRLTIEQISPAIGAVVTGVDLGKPLDRHSVDEIRASVLERGVVFFREQKLSHDQMLACMANFGTPCIDPFALPAPQPLPARETIINMPTRAYSKATAVWHIDPSLAPEPDGPARNRVAVIWRRHPLGQHVCRLRSTVEAGAIIYRWPVRGVFSVQSFAFEKPDESSSSSFGITQIVASCVLALVI